MTTSGNYLGMVRKIYQYGWDKHFDYLKKYSHKKSLVLDAGSGWFRFAEIASEFNKQVLHLDITRPSSDNLREYNFIQASIESLPFSENSFDFIYCISVLQYIRNEEVAMGEFYRVLKPGGILLLTVPTALSPFRFIRDSEIRFGVYHRVYVPQFKVEVYHYYTRGRIKKLITKRFELLELLGDNYNFIPRLTQFIFYSLRLDKIFVFLRLRRFLKVVMTGKGKVIEDGRQRENSEGKNQIIKQPEKEIIKQGNATRQRVSFISDFSYHYIIVLQKSQPSNQS
jgi:SAM-dependent methyltransferase